MKPNKEEVCRLYGLKEAEAENVLCMYDSASHNLNGFCIMGRRSDIAEIIGRRELDDYVHTGTTANFFYTDINHPGNVLDTLAWNIARNDAWVLGGIDSHCTFNVAYSQRIENEDDVDAFIQNCIVSTGIQYPHTVTAREILGLKNAGYKAVILHGVLLFVPKDGHESISLAAYYSAVNYARLDSPDPYDKNYVEAEIRNFIISGFNN